MTIILAVVFFGEDMLVLSPTPDDLKWNKPW